MKTDNDWMKMAIGQAKNAMTAGEVPVGAVLVKQGKLLGKAHNQPISSNDPTAHAEIQLLRLCAAKLANYRLPNTVLYVTLEPCVMCFGAMIHSRISRLVFGANDPKTGACGSCTNLTTNACFNHKIQVEGKVLADECGALLVDFFKTRR